MDIQIVYRKTLSVVLMVTAVMVGIILPFRIMLYGGIMQAIENWGTDNPAVVWGIIKAVFFEVGVIPAYLIGFFSVACWKS